MSRMHQQWRWQPHLSDLSLSQSQQQVALHQPLHGSPGIRWPAHSLMGAQSRIRARTQKTWAHHGQIYPSAQVSHHPTGVPRAALAASAGPCPDSKALQVGMCALSECTLSSHRSSSHLYCTSPRLRESHDFAGKTEQAKRSEAEQQLDTTSKSNDSHARIMELQVCSSAFCR